MKPKKSGLENITNFGIIFIIAINLEAGIYYPMLSHGHRSLWEFNIFEGGIFKPSKIMKVRIIQMIFKYLKDT